MDNLSEGFLMIEISKLLIVKFYLSTQDKVLSSDLVKLLFPEVRIAWSVVPSSASAKTWKKLIFVVFLAFLSIQL